MYKHGTSLYMKYIYIYIYIYITLKSYNRTYSPMILQVPLLPGASPLEPKKVVQCRSFGLGFRLRVLGSRL